MPDNDETTFLPGHTSVDHDRPLAHLAEVENRIKPDEGPDVLGEPESTHDRLRAFEDKILGEDHPRPNGKIEKGRGAKFHSVSVTAEQRAHHAALESLIAAEDEHKKASAAEEIAHARLEAAIKRASETEETI